MGLYKEVHIGPYIQMTYIPKPIIEINKKCPAHTKIKFKKTDEFCNICGKNLIKIETEVKQKMNYWQLLKEHNVYDKYEDELIWIASEYSKDKLLLVSNTLSFFDTDDEYGSFEITPIIIQWHIDEFKIEHNTIIEFLRNVADIFNIRYGVIIDYH